MQHTHRIIVTACAVKFRLVLPCRVAAERGEPPPASGPASTVGYHVRLDAAVNRNTRLTFCTTGILLRRLAADPLLSSISHIVVDEVRMCVCACVCTQDRESSYMHT